MSKLLTALDQFKANWPLKPDFTLDDPELNEFANLCAQSRPLIEARLKNGDRYVFLKETSATYTVKQAPLQLIVQEGHGVHRTHGAVGYRQTHGRGQGQDLGSESLESCVSFPAHLHLGSIMNSKMNIQDVVALAQPRLKAIPSNLEKAQSEKAAALLRRERLQEPKRGDEAAIRGLRTDSLAAICLYQQAQIEALQRVVKELAHRLRVVPDFALEEPHCGDEPEEDNADEDDDELTIGAQDDFLPYL